MHFGAGALTRSGLFVESGTIDTAGL